MPILKYEEDVESPLLQSLDLITSEEVDESTISDLLLPQASSLEPHIPKALQNDSNFHEKFYFAIDTKSILLCIVLVLFISWVIVSNCLNIYGLWKLPKFHLIDIYFVNLAVCDVLLAIFVFPLMSTVVLLGYFPFGVYICGIWVFIDYYLIIGYSLSITALVCVCLWMLKWPDVFNETKISTHLLIVGFSWFGVNAVWSVPFVQDRINREYPKGACGFSPRKNSYFTFYIGLVGFYIPLIVSLACAIWSAALIRKYSHHAYLFQKSQKNKTEKKIHLTRQSSSNMPEPIVRRLGTMKHATDSFPIVASVLVLFFVCRCLFYVYFGAGAFIANVFPPDLSNGVYWMLHANAALSPVVHFALDHHLRDSLKKALFQRL